MGVYPRVSMDSADNTTPISLWYRRLSRRELLARGSDLAILSALTPGCASLAQQEQRGARLGFQVVAPSYEDTLIVPQGYRADVLLRWGDRLFSDTPTLDSEAVVHGELLKSPAARDQTRQFGYNCDGIGILDTGNGELLICVNHEYPNPELLFPGYRAAQRAGEASTFIRKNPQCVEFMQATVGVSIAHFQFATNWQLKVDSLFNRRITANTPMELSGPARGHDLLKTRQDVTGTRVNGTFYNCAAGMTPWGTYLTAEEGIDDFFGNRRAASLTSSVEQAYNRFRPRGLESRFRWEFADPRFNVALNPKEPLKFGWIVELDPQDASKPIKKRTALGRFKHEGATTVVAPDGRVVVYMGDDQAFEYLYKFVTRDVMDPENTGRILPCCELAYLTEIAKGQLIDDGFHPIPSSNSSYSILGEKFMNISWSPNRYAQYLYVIIKIENQSLTKEEAIEQISEILDIAIMIRYQDTKEFENYIRSLNGDRIVEVFTKNVKLSYF